MAKKKVVIGISVFLAFIAMIGAMFLFLSPVQQTSYFYDEGVGIIKAKVTVYDSWNKWMRIFEQAVTFSQTQVDLGNSVSLTDETFVGSLPAPINPLRECVVSLVEISISGGGTPAYLSKAVTARPLNTISNTFTFTPSSAGTYSANTQYYVSECDAGLGTNCQSTAACGQGIWTESSTNSVNVIDNTPPACTKNPKWGPWELNSDISNGRIDKRVFFDVDNSCNFYESEVEYRTTCNDGYQISGTNGDSTGSGQLTCEQIPIQYECTTDDDCSNQICELNSCVDYECVDGDEVTISCEDNSTIITQTCTNNRLMDTNNECPIVDNPDNQNTTDANDTDTNTITLISCWRVLYPVQQETLSNETSCEQVEIEEDSCDGIDYFDTESKCESSLEEPKVNYALWLLIGAVLIASSILTLILYKRFRK